MAKYNAGDIISVNRHKHCYYPQDKTARVNLLILKVGLAVYKKYTGYNCFCLNIDLGVQKYYTFDSRDKDIFKVGEDNVAV